MKTIEISVFIHHYYNRSWAKLPMEKAIFCLLASTESVSLTYAIPFDVLVTCLGSDSVWPFCGGGVLTSWTAGAALFLLVSDSTVSCCEQSYAFDMFPAQQSVERLAHIFINLQDCTNLLEIMIIVFLTIKPSFGLYDSPWVIGQRTFWCRLHSSHSMPLSFGCKCWINGLCFFQSFFRKYFTDENKSMQDMKMAGFLNGSKKRPLITNIEKKAWKPNLDII